MKCEKVRTKLSAYMDGEVDPELHREIESHLEHCQECRHELLEFGGVDTFIKRLPRFSPPSDFAAAVASEAQDLVSSEQRRHFFRYTWNRACKILLEYSERFLELLEPEERIGTRSLDEFNDIPASFIGHAYFNLLGSQK